MFPISIHFTTGIPSKNPTALADQLLQPMNAFMSQQYLQELERGENRLVLRAKPLQANTKRFRQIPKIALHITPQSHTVNIEMLITLWEVFGLLVLELAMFGLAGAWLASNRNTAFALVCFAAALFGVIAYIEHYITMQQRAKSMLADLEEWAHSLERDRS